MFGVPQNLPVATFVGKEFCQVCLGQFQIQFQASGTGSISVEGKWELRDRSGNLVDSAQDHRERRSYRVHVVIGVPIIRVAVEPPRSFSLFFENGMCLTIFDDSSQYESFSVNLDGRGGIYI